VWDSLDAPELAAVVSTMVYEPRRDDHPSDRMPSPAVHDALAATTRIWATLADDEEDFGLPRSRQPELGFVQAVHRWARGERLDRVLTLAAESGAELTAGDFVRWCKQVIDLLDQIGAAPAPDGDELPVSATARAAVSAIRRGVVAQSLQP